MKSAAKFFGQAKPVPTLQMKSVSKFRAGFTCPYMRCAFRIERPLPVCLLLNCLILAFPKSARFKFRFVFADNYFGWAQNSKSNRSLLKGLLGGCQT